MNILALDCATTTGWASTVDSQTESGIITFKTRRGCSPGLRFMEFRKWVRDVIVNKQPSVVCYEIAHHRGGAATELCVGFTTRVMEEASVAGVEYMGIRSDKLKKHATGKGNASKGAMQEAAAAKWPHYKAEDDPGADEADALWLLSYAQTSLKGDYEADCVQP